MNAHLFNNKYYVGHKFPSKNNNKKSMTFGHRCTPEGCRTAVAAPYDCKSSAVLGGSVLFFSAVSNSGSFFADFWAVFDISELSVTFGLISSNFI